MARPIRSKIITFAITKDENKSLEDAVNSSNLSKSEFIRLAIDNQIKKVKRSK